MINSGQCPKCGNTSIAGPHNIHTGGEWGSHHVKIDLPGMLTATLEAITCDQCGYTELYADNMGLSNIRSSGRYLRK